MLKTRIIPCLDVKDGRVVKGVNFVDLIDAGDPVEAAAAYDAAGADELCFLDITASSDNRETIFDIVERTAERCFMPLTVGGGVRTVEDIRRLLTAGENKGFLDPFLPVDDKQKQHAQALLEDIHQQFIGVVREGRGKRLKETPDMFTGLIWTGQKSVELGLADEFGSLDYVAREVVKAENIVDYTQKENLAEKFARRFGAGAAGAILELAIRQAPQLR